MPKIIHTNVERELSFRLFFFLKWFGFHFEDCVLYQLFLLLGFRRGRGWSTKGMRISSQVRALFMKECRKEIGFLSINFYHVLDFSLMQFDRMLVMSESWPPSYRAHPLLPLLLLRCSSPSQRWQLQRSTTILLHTVRTLTTHLDVFPWR